ncbi:MAG: hypothetical protein WCR44_06070 [Verrucomicrobiota bacterium]
MDMNPDHQQNELENPQNDTLWNLLSADAKAHPIVSSPWFAARTLAQVRAHRQSNTKSLLFRWLLPIPLAGLAAVALLALHGVGSQNLLGFGKAGTYVSTDSEFEQDMDLLCSTE